MTGDRPTEKRSAFVERYAADSGMAVDAVLAVRQPRRCRCEYEGCTGWQMLSPEEAAVHDRQVADYARDTLARHHLARRTA